MSENKAEEKQEKKIDGRSRNGGQNRHVPTPETRASVASLNSFGITGAQICLYLGIDEKTLKKHYQYEMDTSHIKANEAVANRLYKKAVEDGDSTCLIFWLKTRAQWREPDKKEIRQENAQILDEIRVLREKLLLQNEKDF